MYVSLITLFGLLYWLTASINYSNNSKVTDFFDCCYFSFVSFMTIGYGDIAPVRVGKSILFLETIFSIGFTAVFTAMLAFQFLRRPQKYSHLRKIIPTKIKKATF